MGLTFLLSHLVQIVHGIDKLLLLLKNRHIKSRITQIIEIK